MHSAVEIILVEDNESDADLVMRTLKRNNLANNVLHLQDGQEVLNYFFSESIMKNSSNPKVILLDLKMPKVNGIEVLEKLKENEYTSTIPVVILTSSAEESDLKKCYELGANSYVVKPVAFEDFVQKISQLGVYWLLVNETKK
jgi:two-component system, response regulator